MSNRDADEQGTYKKARNLAWLLLVAGWIFVWYLYLDGERAAEVARINDCRQSGGASGLLCAGAQLVGTADAKFSFCMLLAVIASPLMFFPARYLARQYVSHAALQAARREDQEREATQRLQQQESQKRLAHGEAEAVQAREKNSRTEIIMKLGSINDLVDVMAVEKDQERLMHIRLGVAQALRELSAKYDMAMLGALIQSDDAACITVRAVIERMEQSSLSNLVELELLKTATGRGRKA